MKRLKQLAPALILGLLFLWSVFRFGDIASILAPLVQGKRMYVERESLQMLALQHLALSLGSSFLAMTIAFPLGLVVANERDGIWRDLADRIGAFGETFPTAALIAFLVPSLGYGTAPVAMALTIYGILPVLRSTMSGIRAVPPEVLDAARGLGMTERQMMIRVRIPLAMPLVIQGFRVCLVTTIAAATIGAAVGAGGFGVLIVSGIRSFDTLLILKGSIPVALLALFIDSVLTAMQEILFPKADS